MNISIAGAGNISSLLTEKLAKGNNNITIFENRDERIAYANEHLDAMIVDGDVLNMSLQRRAGSGHADIFIALTQNDSVNILACQIAKKLGAKKTIARVRDSQYIIKKKNIFSPCECSVDFFIHPEYETAAAISRLINQIGTTDIIEIEEGKIQFLGLYIDNKAHFLHIPFKDFNTHFGDLPMRIVAIKRRTFTLIPRGEDILIPGDQIFFICDPKYKEKILQIFGKQDAEIKDIMIIGGGLIGKFIAKNLEHSMNVKIIEADRKKADRLAEILDKSLVIHGDGSDLDLLHSEGLTEMDEVITVTGDDETNIITTTIARHLDVRRTITLINKNEYLPLISALNLEAVVSKHHLTVNAISNYIRRESIAQISELPGLDAAIVEFIVSKKSKIAGKALKNIKFPNRTLIGAILKNDGRIIIPQGDTIVEMDDKVVVFCDPISVEPITKLFKK